MITKEFREGPTPMGGVKSEIYYFDDNWNSIDKKKATKVMIRELDKQGNLIFETHGTLNNG